MASRPYTLTLGQGWTEIAPQEITQQGPTADANGADGSRNTGTTYAVHTGTLGTVDAQLTVVTTPRRGMQLDSYLTTAALALADRQLLVESAALHDDLRADHIPTAIITYTAGLSQPPSQLSHGRQAALLSTDGQHLIIASLAAADPDAAAQIYVLVANLELGPRHPVQPNHHSSTDWSVSPTMRKLR
jgi:hypothetical protein